jgi:hypothetical protein
MLYCATKVVKNKGNIILNKKPLDYRIDNQAVVFFMKINNP